MPEPIIAVDPGREKCGIAVVHKQKGILYKNVIGTSTLATAVRDLVDTYNTTTIVLGDRTSSREARRTLEQIRINDLPLILISVDEHHSTDDARHRYWRENPPRGLMRLIPVTMQVPPVPVDDYVAVILAERYFGKG